MFGHPIDTLCDLLGMGAELPLNKECDATENCGNCEKCRRIINENLKNMFG